jgi:hypothetical protein
MTIRDWCILSNKGAKNPIKANGHNHHMEDKREGQKIHHPQEPKKGKS